MNSQTPVDPCAHAHKGPLLKFLYFARNIISGRMFEEMRQYSRGHVLDIGGLDFFETAKEKGIPFEKWTTIEPSEENTPKIDDPRFSFIACDGCDMRPIETESMDTVLCIQVVEHVLEPLKMVDEIGRVLKKGGHAIFLIPQTGTLHMLPDHYYNFTTFWIRAAMNRANLHIVKSIPLGGRWSSTASHMLYFLFQRFGAKSMVVPEQRNLLFYLLAPFQILLAIILVPICLLFGLGDLKEEANNHLVVVQKPN